MMAAGACMSLSCLPTEWSFNAASEAEGYRLGAGSAAMVEIAPDEYVDGVNLEFNEQDQVIQMCRALGDIKKVSVPRSMIAP